MNNKKKMVLGAAFVVAIMALAGIGYAIADNFHGTTSTSARDADVDFVKVYLRGEDYATTAFPIAKSLYWDTVTSWNTSSSATETQYTARAGGITVDYEVTIDITSVEPTDKIELTVSGLSFTGLTGTYTVACTWTPSGGSASEVTITDGNGTLISETAAGSNNITGTFSVTVTPSDSPKSSQPDVKITFPAITFKVTGENVAAPASA